MARALSTAAPAATPPPAALPAIRHFADTRKASYLSAWHLCDGNMSAAARQLGVSYCAYREALIEWGVVRSRPRGS